MLIIYYQKMSNKYRKISTIFLNKVKSDVKIQFTKIPTYYRKLYDTEMYIYRSATQFEKILTRVIYGGISGVVIGIAYGSYLTHFKYKVISDRYREISDRHNASTDGYIDNYISSMCFGGCCGSFVGLTYQLIPVYIGLYAIDRTFKIYGKIKRC
jgi:hypothetical protein